MKFELDDTLIDDIIFQMENQGGYFMLDTQEGQVVSADFYDGDDAPDFDDNERFIDIPDWSSNDGFRLMEKFANTCKSPIIRQELSKALNRHKGVFRAFRDVLEQYPETEKQWYVFKDREMKKEVIDWYNGLREEWGLEPIGEEPEDNSALVLEDFVIKQEPCPESEICFVAKSAASADETAGCICAVKDETGLRINKLEVNEKFRGMGLGKTLLSKLIEKIDGKTIKIDLPAESEFFARALHLEGFRPLSQKFILN